MYKGERHMQGIVYEYQALKKSITGSNRVADTN